MDNKVTINREKVNQSQKVNEKKAVDKNNQQKKPGNFKHDKKDFKKTGNNNKNPNVKVKHEDSGYTYRPFEAFFKKQQEEKTNK